MTTAPALRWYFATWLAFGVSMALPVIDAAGEAFGGLRGWEAFVLSFQAPFRALTTPRAELDASAFEASVYFIPNLVMLLSPLYAFRPSAPITRRAMTAACVVAVVVALLPLRSTGGLQAGYWLWVLSILALFAAVIRQRLEKGARSFT